MQHIKYDDMEQGGYEFEKGRMKAKEAQKKFKQPQIRQRLKQ